jgi:hypothetical protein
MTVILKENKRNFRAWRKAVVHCASQKGAKGVVEAALPDAVEDAAVKYFIELSIPEIWMDELTDSVSAYDFINWVSTGCTGGKSGAPNTKWIKEMERGMEKGETM